MKKINILFLAFTILMFSLTGCGGERTTTSKGNTNTSSDSSVASVQNTSGASDTVVVPNVVGKDIAEATKELEGLGLKVKNTYKILQVKEIVGGEATYYDNNIVIDQSHKKGTIVVNGTEIELTVNQWNEFIYDVNDNNTITLTGLGNSLYYPNKQLYIPKEYNGYKVYCIKSDLLNSKQADTWGNAITYLIPTDVIIDGETSVEIIRY